MPRSISSALQAEFSKPITRVGYLLSISLSPVLQWCSVGTVNWDSKVWVDYSFDIRGIGGDEEVVLTVQNVDNAVAAAFMDADLAAVDAEVWQVAPAALGSSDVVRVGRFMFGPVDIAPDKMTARLVQENSIDAFSPRDRVDPANGFSYALPEGAKIYWENEVYVNGLDPLTQAPEAPGGRRRG